MSKVTRPSWAKSIALTAGFVSALSVADVKKMTVAEATTDSASLPAEVRAPAAPVTSSETTVAVPSKSDAKVVGNVELRPAWELNTDVVKTTNQAELGYQFTKDAALIYRQEINSNLYNPKAAGPNGADPSFGNGIVRASMKNILVSENMGLGLNYEGRVYLPTDSSLRDVGFKSAVRNYFIVKKSLWNGANLNLYEIPIVHFYDRAGSANSGTLAANPTVENRVYLELEMSFFDGKLSATLPVNLNTVKYREFAGASNSNAVQHNLWIYPEIDYNITPNLLIGIAYQSGPLMRSDLKQLTVNDGLKTGTAEFAIRASL